MSKKGGIVLILAGLVMLLLGFYIVSKPPLDSISSDAVPLESEEDPVKEPRSYPWNKESVTVKEVEPENELVDEKLS